MKNLGYGKDYQYDPDTTDGFSGADYFPDDMDRETYYQPTRNGYEAQISERLRHWAYHAGNAETPRAEARSGPARCPVVGAPGCPCARGRPCCRKAALASACSAERKKPPPRRTAMDPHSDDAATSKRIRCPAGV